MPSPDSVQQPTKSGIVTDANGQRHIPSSTRADGSKRREIKIRPGYKPPEDVELYRNRTAEAFRTRGGRGGGVPGADAANENEKPGATAASNKNAKRREARRKAKAAAGGDDGGEDEVGDEELVVLANPQDVAGAAKSGKTGGVEEAAKAVGELAVDDAEAEKEKKIKRLRKKLREARDLQSKKERGEGLLPEQLQKVIRVNEIIRELGQLGCDANGEVKAE